MYKLNIVLNNYLHTYIFNKKNSIENKYKQTNIPREIIFNGCNC